MLSPYLYAALAHEHHQTLLAQTETDRRARQARLHRRQATGRPVILRDGSAVLIRQVQSADAPLLADGFARLSDRSRQLRFLTPKKALSPAELRYFTDIDHQHHEALGALNHADGRGVGIARYVRDADDPQAAEIAVTIIDDWHGRGLGTELVAQLSERARSEGIRRFTALVAADNRAVAGLLREVRADFVRREPGALRYEIMLVPAEQYSPAGAAGLALSSGSRMRAVVRRAKYRTVLRGCDRSAGRGSVARGGPKADGAGNEAHSYLWGGWGHGRWRSFAVDRLQRRRVLAPQARRDRGRRAGVRVRGGVSQ